MIIKILKGNYKLSSVYSIYRAFLCVHITKNTVDKMLAWVGMQRLYCYIYGDTQMVVSAVRIMQWCIGTLNSRSIGCMVKIVPIPMLTNIPQ